MIKSHKNLLKLLVCQSLFNPLAASIAQLHCHHQGYYEEYAIRTEKREALRR